jgi:hypothetical protein
MLVTNCSKGSYTQFFWLTIEVDGKEYEVTVEENYCVTSDIRTHSFVSEDYELSQQEKDELIEYVNTKVE